jgi:hypothetical protein
LLWRWTRNLGEENEETKTNFGNHPKSQLSSISLFLCKSFWGTKKRERLFFFFVFGYLRRFMVIAAATTTIMIIAAAMPM